MKIHAYSPMSRSLKGSDRLARGVGWFSLGLGLFKLFAPRTLTRSLGLEGTENLVRVCGAREVATGIGALAVDPRPALWARVGGDALDMATLATALQDTRNPKRRNLEAAVLAVGAITAVDLCIAQAQSRRRAYQAGPTPDYSDRSGFPRGLEHARGAARTFETPGHMNAELPSPARSPGPRTPTSRTNNPNRS